MRLKSLAAEDRARIFEWVIELYLTGPKLSDIAARLGVGYRTLQRFMTEFDRKGEVQIQLPRYQQAVVDSEYLWHGGGRNRVWAALDVLDLLERFEASLGRRRLAG